MKKTSLFIFIPLALASILSVAQATDRMYLTRFRNPSRRSMPLSWARTAL